MKKMIVPILALFFVSCEEEIQNTLDSASAVEALTEYAIVNNVFQDAGNNSGDAILSSEDSASSSKTSQTKADGPIITIEPLDFSTFPKTITVNYQDGFLCKDGITRKGIVTIISTNWYGIEGSEHTTTFNNYYHNDYKVEGTHYAKNMGENSDGDLEYHVTITNGKIITTAGKTINYTENSTRTWVAGSNTPLNIWDDEYMLDGTQSGVSSKGVTYTLTVEEPLHFVLLPRSIDSGILDIDVASINDIKLNYSTSTITILGKTFPFGN
ncbi:hypothetical protein EV196_102601 [Mariniflexile fucanivorans]|uniref:Uncharacterized protein n=1 Tax=Mariniflexile fucanivorans TaxID=264023 RepID=A0A4V2QEG9_9FLAO|nr:hypothetical protein [Mariniflexile fucanivorans]TCL68037.1 hypothetical protein EV196_102601 [Mariniflexile fucanivorans]